MINRRRFLGLTAVTAGGVIVTTGGLTLPQLTPGAQLRTARALPPAYQVPLPVPPVLAPVRTDATTDYYEITQRPANLTIFPGVSTPAWTYQGTYPGPTIVSRAGRRAVVRHTNQLPSPVVVHLHGGHTPHDSDGYPADLVPPGDHRDYTYPFHQRAATLWYHDHRMGFTGPSVWRGLAGFHLVHDDEEDALPLPKGDHDIPIMIADRAFDAEGLLTYPSLDPTLTDTPGVTDAYANGVLGDVILVNGAPWPVLRVDRAKYRLRLLNASNSRRYRLVLTPGAIFTQIGSDGGLLSAPIAQPALELAPAERFDVIIDFAAFPAGARVELRNTLGTGSTAQVMRFDVAGPPVRDDATIPATLSRSATLDPASAVVTRNFLFQNAGGSMSWRINGQAYDPAHPLARPGLGQTEIWRFVTDLHHPIHLHLDSFEVLGRNGKQPGPYDHGWKDTLDLYPAQSAEILVRFTDYAGRFVFHCHNLEHEDMAMMADFVTR
jgi:FtsP/CotA-like multicopper oxidase with cupredoxin domain